jgi:hypothetical protein
MTPWPVGGPRLRPRSWGKPYAEFPFSDGHCPAALFSNNSLTIDLTFGGDWSEFPWLCTAERKQARDPDASVAEWVVNHPDAFTEGYWLFNHISVWSVE